MARGCGILRILAIFGLTGCAAACVWMAGGEAGGQVRIRIGGIERSTPAASAELLTNRTLSRGLRQAKERIAAGEYSEALHFLDEALGRSDDSFVEADESPDAESTPQQSGEKKIVEAAGLKETAWKTLRDLPPEGKAAYRAAFGGVAERLLNEALSSGDEQAIEGLAFRYFHTPAGIEAAFIHAMHEMDAGRRLHAALLFRRLLEAPEATSQLGPALALRAAACSLAAGDAAEAERLLEELSAGNSTATDRSAKGGSVQIAGEERSLDAHAVNLEWLRQTLGTPRGAGADGSADWPTYRGNAGRTAVSVGGLPHMRERWRVRLLHPRLVPLYQRLSTDQRQAGAFLPTASNALAVGNVVVLRTGRQLLAVNFTTGKRIWQAEVEESSRLEELIDQASSAGESPTDAAAVAHFSQRMWHDYLYHGISSDGKRVYVLGELQRDMEVDQDMLFKGMDRSSWMRPETNRLTALDLESEGKRVWEIRGATVRGPLAGAHFLGAPTPVGDTAFALVEIKRAICLAALDGGTGELKWLQQLATLEASFPAFGGRRLASLMPSYDSGILVCPTEAGVVVGVDVARRSLGWAYRYRSTSSAYALGAHDEFRDPAAGQAWLNHAPTIVNGRALLTPADSTAVHCIDLQSGKAMWERPRGENLQLACANDRVALMLGNRSVTALRLEDGEPAWEPAELSLSQVAETATPIGIAGSGFASGGSYFFPLTSGEIVEVELATGRIVARAAARDGVALGNLICHDGAVLSNDGASLDRYDEIETLRSHSAERLTASPNDVDALRTLGEIALNEGRLGEAVEKLEKALAEAPDDYEVRNVLAESLSAALVEDFAAHRSRIGLLEDLQRDVPGKQAALLRIRSQGLLEEGDVLGAAAACFALYRALANGDDVLTLGRGYSARASRWGRAQLTQIWERANPAERDEIEAQAKRLVGDEASNAALDGNSASTSTDFFSALPIGRAWKFQRAERLLERDAPLAAQQLLLDLSEKDVAAPAENTPADAALVDRARRRLEAWDATQSAATASSPAESSWPLGKVELHEEIDRLAKSREVRARAATPREIRMERTDAALDKCNLFFSAHNNGGELTLRNSAGRELWRAPLLREGQGASFDMASMYGMTRGHLVVVSFGREIVAIDAQQGAHGEEGPQRQRVLWQTQAARSLENGSQLDVVEPANRVPRPGTHRARRAQVRGEWVGVVGPLTSHGCVTQDQNGLTCRDPFTGETLWSRGDLPPGCDLFGDDELVFAVPRWARRCYAFSAIDGRRIGERATPLWEETLAVRGRRVVSWTRNEAAPGYVLRAIDVASQSPLWSLSFAAESRVDVAAGRWAAVVQPDGRTAIVDLETGSLRVDSQGEPVDDMRDVYLLAGADAFVVVVGTPPSTGGSRHVNPLLKDDYPIVSGKVYCFDCQTGRAKWSRPAEVEEQSFMLSQPVDLPVIAFVGTLQSQQAGGSGATMTLLLLDKRTGQTVVRRDDLPPAAGSWCELRADAEVENQLIVETRTCKLQLKFTAAPAPPLPPAMAEVEQGGTKTSGGLEAILKKSLEGPLPHDGAGLEDDPGDVFGLGGLGVPQPRPAELAPAPDVAPENGPLEDAPVDLPEEEAAEDLPADE